MKIEVTTQATIILDESERYPLPEGDAFSSFNIEIRSILLYWGQKKMSTNLRGVRIYKDGSVSSQREVYLLHIPTPIQKIIDEALASVTPATKEN